MTRAGREILTGANVLFAVPLHWRRQWTRRFNQSTAFAGAISSAGCEQHAQARAGNAASSRAGRRPNEPTMYKGLPRAGRAQGRHYRTACGAGRRRADVKRDRRCLRPSVVAGGRRPYRRSGIRVGCGASARSHIIGFCETQKPYAAS